MAHDPAATQQLEQKVAQQAHEIALLKHDKAQLRHETAYLQGEITKIIQLDDEDREILVEAIQHLKLQRQQAQDAAQDAQHQAAAKVEELRQEARDCMDKEGAVQRRHMAAAIQYCEQAAHEWVVQREAEAQRRVEDEVQLRQQAEAAREQAEADLKQLKGVSDRKVEELVRRVKQAEKKTTTVEQAAKTHMTAGAAVQTHTQAAEHRLGQQQPAAAQQASGSNAARATAAGPGQGPIMVSQQVVPRCQDRKPAVGNSRLPDDTRRVLTDQTNTQGATAAQLAALSAKSDNRLVQIKSLDTVVYLLKNKNNLLKKDNSRLRLTNDRLKEENVTLRSGLDKAVSRNQEEEEQPRKRKAAKTDTHTQPAGPLDSREQQPPTAPLPGAPLAAAATAPQLTASQPRGQSAAACKALLAPTWPVAPPFGASKPTTKTDHTQALVSSAPQPAGIQLIAASQPPVANSASQQPTSYLPTTTAQPPGASEQPAIAFLPVVQPQGASSQQPAAAFLPHTLRMLCSLPMAPAAVRHPDAAPSQGGASSSLDEQAATLVKRLYNNS